jgi:hypothetical protein
MFTKNTIIQTENGHKLAGEIQKGDFILNHKLELDDIKYTNTESYRQLAKIKTESGKEIVCDSSLKMFCKIYEWTRAFDICYLWDQEREQANIVIHDGKNFLYDKVIYCKIENDGTVYSFITDQCTVIANDILVCYSKKDDKYSLPKITL